MELLSLLLIVLATGVHGQDGRIRCYNNRLLDIEAIACTGNRFIAFDEGFYTESRITGQNGIPAAIATGATTDRYLINTDPPNRRLDSVAIDGNETFFFRGEQMDIFDSSSSSFFTYPIYDDYPALNKTIANANYTILSVNAALRLQADGLFVIRQLFCQNGGSACDNYTSQHFVDANDRELRFSDDQLLRTPTAMCDIGRTRDQQELLVFYGPFWERITVKSDFSSLLLMDSTRDYKVANEWIGCFAELCFDAAPDAIDFDRQQVRFNLFRGTFFFPFRNLSNTAMVPQPRLIRNAYQINGPVDAVHSTANNTYLFLPNNQVAIVSSADTTNRINGTTNNVFRGLDAAAIVNAVFEFANITYVITADNRLQRYTLVGTVFNALDGPSEEDWASQVPLASISAAVNIGTNLLLFFRGNFYYQFNSTDNTLTVPPRLVQELLFNCDDEFYSANVSRYLNNINNFEGFRRYREQFRDVLPSATPGEGPPFTVYIFGGVALLLLVVFAAFLFYTNRRSMSGSFSSSRTASIDQDRPRTLRRSEPELSKTM